MIDERDYEYNVKVGSEVVKSDPFDNDPFAESAEALKSLSGVNPNLKRNLSRKLKKAVDSGAGSKQLEPQALTGYDLFGVVTPPYNLEYLAELMDKSSPHGASIRTKVSNIVGLGYDFVESTKAKDRIERTATEDQLQNLRRKLERAKLSINDWLDDTNKEVSFQETLVQVWTDYEATGNGYIEIGRTAVGEIGYIGHLPASSMRVRRHRDGFVQIAANKAVFFRNFQDTDTPDPIGNDRMPNEVIHIKKYSPTNTYYGVPEIVSAIDAVLGSELASRFNLDYFEHKAVPRYVIVVKGAKLSKGSEDRIIEFFQGALKGKNHRTLYVPLPADTIDGQKSSFEMKPVESGTLDASFLNYDRSNLLSVLMADRVPISKVGHVQGMSLAAARDADKTFKETVCRPEQRMLEKKLNRIIKEKTDIFLIKLNELTLTDENTLSQMDERYLRMKVITPNEVRARWGWAGLEGGDEPVELNSQQNADQRANARQSRRRDSERTAGATDSIGEGRNEQGAGRVTE